MRVKEIKENYILFDDGTLVVAVHDQAVGEHVYADFKVLLDSPFMDIEFNDIKIELVKGAGVRINNFFVPCYNVQDVICYSSDLSIYVIPDYGGGRSYDLDGFAQEGTYFFNINS